MVALEIYNCYKNSGQHHNHLRVYNLIRVQIILNQLCRNFQVKSNFVFPFFSYCCASYFRCFHTLSFVNVQIHFTKCRLSRNNLNPVNTSHNSVQILQYHYQYCIREESVKMYVCLPKICLHDLLGNINLRLLFQTLILIMNISFHRHQKLKRSITIIKPSNIFICHTSYSIGKI